MTRSLTSLPVDIILEVSDHLNPADLSRLVLVSKSLATVLCARLYDLFIFKYLLRKVAAPEKAFDLEITLIYLKNETICRLNSQLFLNYFRANLKRILPTRDPDEQTILHHFVGAENPQLLDTLLANCTNADLEAKDKRGNTPLATALLEGPPSSILLLVEAGANVLARAYDGERPLLTLQRPKIPLSVYQKLIDAIRAAGGDPFDGDKDGHSPLHYAALAGNKSLVQFLISNGADVFAGDKLGHPPLVHAVLHSRIEVTKLLLNTMQAKGYDINTPVSSCRDATEPWMCVETTIFYDPGDTLLHLAVGTWNTRMVKLLLNAGANPLAENAAENWPPRTPFDIAVLGRAPEMVATIAKMKNPPEFWTSNGYIQDGFETCAHESYHEAVRVLLDLRRARKVEIDVDRPRVSVGTPLIGACGYYGTHDLGIEINETVISLVEAGADVNARGPNGTALHVICDGDDERNKHRADLVEYLLAAGADWRIQDDEGNTGLHSVVERGIVPAIKHIISSATPGEQALFAVNNDGNTALHSGVVNSRWCDPDGEDYPGYDAAIPTRLLLDAGFDPNAVNNAGKSPVHLLAGVKDGFIPKIKVLVDAGANLSLKDNDGNPPFHFATAKRHGLPYNHDAVEYFIKSGADIHDGCEQCKAVVSKVHPEL